MTKIGRPRGFDVTDQYLCRSVEQLTDPEHVPRLRRDAENGLRLAAVESAVQYLSCGCGFSAYPADSSVALARARLFSMG